MFKPTDKTSCRPHSANRSSQKQINLIREPIRTVDGQLRIKTYQKLKLVGQGAYSKCYLAKNVESDSTYVVKIIPKKKLQVLAKQKLIYQIKIHKSLTHPNIVYFDHWFQDDKNKYLFMEYCSNGNLEDKLLSYKNMPQKIIKKYVRQIVQAIAYIHTQNILHRDLKLCNFYLDQNDNIKLGDFGFACQLANEMDRKRQTCGTPNYIAPEAISGFGYSISSDVWAIGVILYRLRYGICPFEGQTVKSTLTNVKICKYTFPSYPKISNDLRDLIEKIFNLNYDDRLTTDQILAHKFFQEQEQNQLQEKKIEKRGFSLKNLFSREKPQKQKSPSKREVMDKSKQSDENKKKNHQKRSNSCETLKEMKEIFKSKSKPNINYTTHMQTKTDYNSFSSINTSQGRQTSRSIAIENSINSNLTFMSMTANRKQQNTRASRLNEFVKSQINSISLKQQLKKGVGIARNSAYLIQDQQIKEKQKNKKNINQTAQKHNFISSQMLYFYSKKYYLPTQIQHEKNIIIAHFADLAVKIIFYEQYTYIVYRQINSVYDLNGKKVQPISLSKIVRHILQYKIKINMLETAHSSCKMQSNEDNDYGDFMQGNPYDNKDQIENIQKLIGKLPYKCNMFRDGAILRYKQLNSSSLIVGKQYTNQNFYIQEEQKSKKKVMYKFDKDEFRVVEGVVWQNYYAAWIILCLKMK